MDYHHSAIEEADRAAMERLEANALQPVLRAIRDLQAVMVSPAVIAAIAAALSQKAAALPDEARAVAQGYFDDLYDDMKGFDRDRI